MPQLIFVRHAQSENNLSSAEIRAKEWASPGQMQSALQRARKPDPPLTELGREQATHLGARLRTLTASPRTLLITSPMRRAIQTSLAIAEAAGLERITCEGELYEVGGCHYCGLATPSANAAQLEAEFPLHCQNIPDGGWYSGHTHIESDDQARARVHRLIAWIETTLAGEAYDTVVIVAHGDLLSRWLRRWLGVPWARDLAFVHANTGVTTLAWDARRGLQLRKLNDDSHLPPELRSGDQTPFWWHYALPDLELRRYQGWADIPPAFASELAGLRERELLAQEGKTMAEYRESDARSFHVAALAEGKLAGYVQYDPEGGRLRQLVLEASARGHGLGRRLVGEIEDECRRQGRSELAVHAWLSSRTFYEAMGFAACGEVVVGGEHEQDWLPMCKQLV